MRFFPVAACLLLAQCGGEPATGAAYLTVLQDDTAMRGTFDATFVASSDAFWAKCHLVTQGACMIYACPPGVHASLLDAGTLSIRGGPIGGTVQVAPEGDDYYAEDFGGRLQFHAGDTFTVSSTGAAVSSFRATVVMPSLVALSMPDVSKPISSAADVELAWTGGESGASVLVEVFDDASHVTCTFPASRATATLPRSAVAEFAGRKTTLQWLQQRDALVLAGSFPVHLIAVNSARVDVTWQ